jgi:hypothetical protein
MKSVAMILAAGAVALGAAMPASAAYVRLGSVDVGYRADMDTAYSRFGGRLESLRLTASRSDILCRSVVVRFDNGTTQNVFYGRLDERRPVDVDLRGRARRVDSIRFMCRSDEFRGGRIYIDGEVGRYVDEWRRDRDWDRVWSGLFGGMGPDRDRDHRGDWDRGRRGDWDDWGGMGRGDWISLGVRSFEGRNDREMDYAGFAGRHVERLGFRPLDGDARCNKIIATFENGQKVNVVSGGSDVLQRGRLKVYDIPGFHRNLVQIYMRCHAIGDYSVRIELFARR